MRLGIDFDNTIVSYDLLFHKVACEQNLIPHDLTVNKLAVRDYLRSINQEDAWTTLQGYVYGARMQEAKAFPQVINVLQRLKTAGHTLFIISHKTKFPYMGEQYNLHDAARDWIKHFLLDENRKPILADTNIFFELTKEEKINRIRDNDIDIFIDDLPEILLAENFPKKTRRFLFDPEQSHPPYEHIRRIISWEAFENDLFEATQDWQLETV